jgi:hypothetical protein
MPRRPSRNGPCPSPPDEISRGQPGFAGRGGGPPLFFFTTAFLIGRRNRRGSCSEILRSFPPLWSREVSSCSKAVVSEFARSLLSRDDEELFAVLAFWRSVEQGSAAACAYRLRPAVLRPPPSVFHHPVSVLGVLWGEKAVVGSDVSGRAKDFSPLRPPFSASRNHNS